MSAFPVLQPDDLVRFACTSCGECCFDQTIVLEPQDLFALTRAGGVAATTSELFERQIVAIETVDGEPRCVLVMRRLGKGTMCRFLHPVIEDDTARRFVCELHGRGAKPLVCSSSPIAQALDGSFALVPPVADCPGMGKGDPRTVAQMTERLTPSRFFHRELRPRLLSEAAVRAVFDFDRDGPLESLSALDQWLRTR